MHPNHHAWREPTLLGVTSLSDEQSSSVRAAVKPFQGSAGGTAFLEPLRLNRTGHLPARHKTIGVGDVAARTCQPGAILAAGSARRGPRTRPGHLPDAEPRT